MSFIHHRRATSPSKFECRNYDSHTQHFDTSAVEAVIKLVIGILDGGERLGKFIGRYREAYFKVGSMNPATGIVFQYVPRQGAEEMIYQRISDITISMKALDYLNMPDCVPTRCEVEMNTQERELYDMLRQDLLIPLKDGDIDAANAASLTGKLLQMKLLRTSISRT